MLPTDLIKIYMSRDIDDRVIRVSRWVFGAELMDESRPDMINRIIGDMASELDAKAEDVTDPKP